MANQEDPNCKCLITKVDIDLKKSNKAKTRDWGKNGIEYKSKEDR